MTADESTKPRDVRFRPAGVGLAPMFLCLGCNTRREPLGSRGTGLRKRCAHCVKGAKA